jgi:hypothetical protein
VKGGGNGSFGVTEKNHESLERRQLGFHPIIELRTSPVRGHAVAQLVEALR